MYLIETLSKKLQLSVDVKSLAVLSFVSDVDDKVCLLNLESTSREECKYV